MDVVLCATQIHVLCNVIKIVNIIKIIFVYILQIFQQQTKLCVDVKYLKVNLWLLLKLVAMCALVPGAVLSPLGMSHTLIFQFSVRCCAIIIQYFATIFTCMDCLHLVTMLRKWIRLFTGFSTSEDIHVVIRKLSKNFF